MIWLTWRQFRFPAAAIFGAAAALALVLVAIGAPDAGFAAVQSLMGNESRVTVYELSSVALLLLPAVIGMFWGAPLVARELEAGTHRLIWNQSVTRTRWLLTKVLVIGLTATAVCAALGLLMAWWANPVDDALAAGQEGNGIAGMPRMAPLLFASRGLVPAGYAAFAFALGVLLGTVLRRTVPAMALTAALFAAIQFTIPPLVRAHLDPMSTTVVVTGENLGGFLLNGPPEEGGVLEELRVKSGQPGAWEISNQTVRNGEVVTDYPTWLPTCVQPGMERIEPAIDEACFQRFAGAGYRQRVTYQPASRYWTFQAIELAGYLAVSAALLGAALFWVRRRIS
jgi:hypothetical protein